MASEAHAQFLAIDWGSNEAWLHYKSKLEFQNNDESVMLAARQKWFKQHIVRFTCTNVTLLTMHLHRNRSRKLHEEITMKQDFP